MENIAPYADTTIPIYLKAVNGPRYRVLNCVECAESFLERQNDSFYRIGVSDMPEEARISESEGVETKCGSCQQRYTVYFSPIDQNYRGDPLLYQKPQTIFRASEPHRHPRDIYCMECHHAYLSLSDRISMVVDEVVTLENLSGIGPIEIRCKAKNCKQRWQVMS